MLFYCYSEIDESSIVSRLGDADYSYYFVLKAYLPLLKKIGQVKVINKLDEEFIADCKSMINSGSRCYLFAFAPPHKIPLELPCTTIPVFAWEYSSIPNREFINNPRDSWSDTLEHFGQALTHSSYAKQVVRRDVSEDFVIESIPAPLWDRYENLRKMADSRHPVKNGILTLGTTIVDSSEFEITTETIGPASRITRKIGTGSTEEQDCRNINIDFSKTNAEIMTIGFYAPEGWGSWSRSATPWIMLPSEVSGKMRLRICASAYGKNIGRDIKLQIGDQILSLKLKSVLQEQEFEIDVQQPSNFICFNNINISAVRTPVDPRTIGLGLASLSIESLSDAAESPPLAESKHNKVEHQIHLEGVVYTTIFNPLDGRKNWEDILTAYCFAFRDQRDVTLILKMTYKDMSGYLDDIFDLFRQLHPFKCRIVVVHGYLSSEEYESLIGLTSYVVNASRSEGQCLPLMEYMSSAIPAIAPINTAMADYINTENAFVVESTPEPSYWPHDPLQIFTTLWYRPSWESLHKAFLDSYEIATRDPNKYSSMSEAAWKSLENYCSSSVLLGRLENFLNDIEKN